MKPAPFEFSAPTDLNGVLERLGHYGDEGRILAGGQSLVPLLNMRMASPAGLVSINRCKELSYIHSDGEFLTIGALARQQEANESSVVREACPLLSVVLPEVGCTASRNRSTICGSLAHADPSAELPAVAVALDASFILRSETGVREVDANEFFVSELCTCIEPGEMLEAVRLPVAKPDARVAFTKLSARRHGFALAAVAAQIVVDGNDVCSSVKLSVVGGGATPLRLRESELALEGSVVSPASISASVAAALSVLDPASDLHAGSEYRRRAIASMIKRTIERAMVTNGSDAK